MYFVGLNVFENNKVFTVSSGYKNHICSTMFFQEKCSYKQRYLDLYSVTRASPASPFFDSLMLVFADNFAPFRPHLAGVTVWVISLRSSRLPLSYLFVNLLSVLWGVRFNVAGLFKKCS